MNKKLNFILFAAIVVAVTLYFVLFTSPGSTLDFGDTSFTLTGPNNFTYCVAYEDIVSLSLDSGIDFGAAVNGGDEKGCTYGIWESEGLGEYSRCTLNKVKPVIVLTDSSGNTLVFNYQSESNTNSVYQGFVDLLDESP